MASIEREYPWHASVHLQRDEDLRPPRELWPSFHGAYDWHSCVHGHWCLVRLMKCYPAASFSGPALAIVGRNLAPDRLAGELDTLSAPGREGFERPYGLAWLLQLATELRGWDTPDARRWSESLGPLERLAADRLRHWLPKLPWPDRSGQHGQTAFALGLALDWARTAGDTDLAETIASRARHFYGGDRDAPLAWEPSGHDFLSPILAEADVMRRVLEPAAFAAWLAELLPDLESEAARRWLSPVASPDPADGKLSHLDGLTLSRAWMLEGVVSVLPASDPRRAPLAAAAARHRATGVAAVTGDHYAGSHWLGTYVVYLETRRGLSIQA